MKKFTPGQQLSQRSICDHNCIFTGEVVKRTAKRVTILVHGDAKTVKIHLDDEGNEFLFPLGQYSMSPTFRA